MRGGNYDMGVYSFSFLPTMLSWSPLFEWVVLPVRLSLVVLEPSSSPWLYPFMSRGICVLSLGAFLRPSLLFVNYIF